MGKPELANFIKFLEDRGLVRFDVIGDGDEKFSNRFKIQKYVFLAKRMGFVIPYEYDIYLCGPYSKTLISDCYDLARNRTEYERADGRLDGAFDADRFLRAIKDRTNKWLEIAATLIERKPHCADRKDLVRRVKNFKNEPEPGYISGVLHKLEELKLA